MICNNCGTNVPDGTEHCYHCGASMAASAEKADVPNVCPHCGTPLSADSAFCTNCGNSVTAAPEAPVVETPAEPKAPKAPGTSFLDKLPIPKNVAILGGAGVLTLLVVVIILCVTLSGGAEGLAEDYVEARLDCDLEGVFELLPEDVLDEYDDELDMYEDYLEESMDSALDTYEDKYGKDWDYSTEVIYVNEYTDKEVRDISKNYRENFGVQVEEAARVILLVVYEGDDSDYGSTWDVTTVKIDGDWYLDYDEIF